MPAPASVTKWALYGGSAAASRGSQPGHPSNQPCGDSTAQAPAATLGTPSATKPSRPQVGTFALVIAVLMPPLLRVAPVRNYDPATPSPRAPPPPPPPPVHARHRPPLHHPVAGTR